MQFPPTPAGDAKRLNCFADVTEHSTQKHLVGPVLNTLAINDSRGDIGFLQKDYLLHLLNLSDIALQKVFLRSDGAFGVANDVRETDIRDEDMEVRNLEVEYEKRRKTLGEYDSFIRQEWMVLNPVWEYAGDVACARLRATTFLQDFADGISRERLIELFQTKPEQDILEHQQEELNNASEMILEEGSLDAFKSFLEAYRVDISNFGQFPLLIREEQKIIRQVLRVLHPRTYARVITSRYEEAIDVEDTGPERIIQASDIGVPYYDAFEQVMKRKPTPREMHVIVHRWAKAALRRDDIQQAVEDPTIWDRKAYK